MNEILKPGGEMDEQISLEGLIDAAKAEDWGTVDENLPKMADKPGVISWSSEKGLDDEDENIKDLSVSIWEAASEEMPEEIGAKLKEMMVNDEGVYVRFRSAFALFKHGNRNPGVIEKIKEALEDKDVKEIAEGYLSELEGEK